MEKDLSQLLKTSSSTRSYFTSCLYGFSWSCTAVITTTFIQPVSYTMLLTFCKNKTTNLSSFINFLKINFGFLLIIHRKFNKLFIFIN